MPPSPARRATAGCCSRSRQEAASPPVLRTSPLGLPGKAEILEQEPCKPPDGRTGVAAEAVLPCETCGLTQRVGPLEPGTVAECIRCGFPIVSRGALGIDVTAALTLAALVLYIPANIYPLLSMNMYGNYTENTVWDGVVSLWQYDQY